MKREIDNTLSEVLQQLVDCKPPGTFLPSPHVGIALVAHPATEEKVQSKQNQKQKGTGRSQEAAVHANLLAVKRPHAGQYGAVNGNLCPAQPRVARKASDHCGTLFRDSQFFPKAVWTW